MSRPNILLIMTDQHRYDAMSACGGPARTPSLQRLGDEGVTFDVCYTTSPVCAPARASVVTGKYPSAHGLWSNGVTLPEQTLISRQLADAGYRCGIIGKRHLSRCFKGTEEAVIDDGFDGHRRWAHDPRHGSPDNAYHQWLADKHPELWAKVRDQVDTPGAELPEGNRDLDSLEAAAHYSTWVAEEAEQFIAAQNGEQPFMLWVNFYDPHHPFLAPPEAMAQYPPGSVPPPIGGPEELASKPSFQTAASQRTYEHHDEGFLDTRDAEIDYFRRAYYAMVSFVDQKVGDILAALATAKRGDDTLVIFTSDHGEMLGDHGLLLKGPMMYEGAVRVPLIMRWPGVTEPGSHCKTFAGLHDVGVTIAAAAGVDPAPDVQGQDLLAIAKGDRPGRDWALVEFRDRNRPEPSAVATTMLRQGNRKLVLWHGQPATTREREGELYDLAADPGELNNLWSQPEHLATRADMLARLADVHVLLEDRTSEREAPW